MKNNILYIVLFFLLTLHIFSQEENSEIEEDENVEIIEETPKEDDKKKVVFRDRLFGIDYTDADLGAMTDIEIINEKDTLVFTRTLGSWWFGPYYNPGGTFYLGNYDFNKISYLPTSIHNPKVEYESQNTLAMLSTGFLVEYAPVRQVWGLGIRLHYETLNVDSEHLPQEVQYKDRIFNTNVTFNYIGFSPYFKYKTPLEGLNLFAGLDFLYPGKYEASFFDRLSTTAEIRDEKVINYDDEIGLRYGISAGAEYEFMAMDIQKAGPFKNTRFKISTFSLVGITSSPISNSGGSYPVSWRVGLAFKLGPDDIKGDTVKYNPTPRLDYLAKFETKVEGQFAGFLERKPFDPVDIELVAINQVSNQVKEEPQLDPSSLRNRGDSQIATSLVEEDKPKLEFKRGDKRTFTFRTSTDVKATKEMREFLDEIAQWMKDNPKAEIRVIGHSDQVGTPQEIQTRSERRAKEVQTYIVGKTGISSRRILTNGQGARVPVADIYTEAGKAKNRRVEIEVVGG